MENAIPVLIQGGRHIDERGVLTFFNNFDMSPVKRFYVIDHPHTTIVRAWQGHKVEKKWFYVVAGSFKINAVKPDSWETPSENLLVNQFVLESGRDEVLHIPGGYANGFKALNAHSRLMVFSNFSMSDAGTDDFRFDKSLWFDWEK